MQCPQCKNEMFIDHVEQGTGKYVYVCVNPNCAEYRQAQTLTGEEKQTQIT